MIITKNTATKIPAVVPGWLPDGEQQRYESLNDLHSKKSSWVWCEEKCNHFRHLTFCFSYIEELGRGALGVGCDAFICPRNLKGWSQNGLILILNLVALLCVLRKIPAVFWWRVPYRCAVQTHFFTSWDFMRLICWIHESGRVWRFSNQTQTYTERKQSRHLKYNEREIKKNLQSHGIWRLQMFNKESIKNLHSTTASTNAGAMEGNGPVDPKSSFGLHQIRAPLWSLRAVSFRTDDLLTGVLVSSPKNSVDSSLSLMYQSTLRFLTGATLIMSHWTL